MTVEQLLEAAWAAVQTSGVPEPLQELAFKEAIAFLRAEATPTDRSVPHGHPNSESGSKPDLLHSDARQGENAFFQTLSRESGVAEADLHDILNLTADGKVQVMTPTKDLGNSIAQQARSVVALVAGARSKGLGEKPVSADAVRQELERKHCYQKNNFAHAHLGPMKGFNAGSDASELLLTSKWVDEFKSALDQAHGRKAPAKSG